MINHYISRSSCLVNLDSASQLVFSKESHKNLNYEALGDNPFDGKICPWRVRPRSSNEFIIEPNKSKVYSANLRPTST